MLRDFFGGGGVDRAVNRLHDDVRSSAVCQRIIEPRFEFRSRKHFFDEQGIGICVEIRRNFRRLALIRQPDQGNVVVLDKPQEPEEQAAAAASTAAAGFELASGNAATKSAKW